MLLFEKSISMGSSLRVSVSDRSNPEYTKSWITSPTARNDKKHNSGFTLIELSIVLVIIGLIIGSVMPAYTGAISTAKYTTTQNKIATITNALNIYYAQNKRLPCPATGSVTNATTAFSAGQNGFALEIYAGFCDATVTPANSAAPTGTKRYLGSDGNANHNIRQGTLPTRVLGLPDDMMYDGYGNKFTYAVTEQFTTSAVAGQITINDGNTTTNPPNPIVGLYAASAGAAFVIVSHGNDGAGAYTQGGTQIACNANKTADAENCGSYGTAGKTTTAFTGITTPDYVFTSAQFNDFPAAINTANWFDDVIGWETENQVIGPMPATMVSIRLTSAATYTGTTANTAACTGDINAGTGYTACTALPSIATPPSMSPSGSVLWLTGGTCASTGATLSNGTGAWVVGTDTCSNPHAVACCK